MRMMFELAATLTDSVLAIWFVTKFCKLESKLRYQAVAVALLVCVTMFANQYLSEFSVLGVLLLAFITLVYIATVNYSINFKHIIATAIFWISLVAVSSLLFIALTFITGDPDNMVMGQNTTARYIFVSLHKVFLFTLLRVLLSFVSIDGKVGKLNAWLTFLLSFFSILGLGATMFIALSDAVNELKLQVAILAVCFVSMNVILYLMLAQISRLQRREYEHKLFEEKTVFDSARYEETTAIWNNVRSIQHDMKHHFSLINAQLEEGKFDEAREYLRKLLPEIESMGRVIRSENKTIDYIINSKLASLKDTQIVISGLIADFSDIEDRDLACLFGNILDNAVEAISELEEKRIEILFSVENASRMVIIKNTIGKSVLKVNPELKSTKKDGSAHGFGHKIVEKIVADHHGMIDYFEEDDMFGVQIILPGISK